MLSKRKQMKEEGFTIIEVLIVLAIAGLIMLIVFLAVPALQRNSRNTQRKNDVSALLTGVSEFTSNNGGTLPITSDVVSTVPKAKRSYYKDDTKISVTSSMPGANTDLETVVIVTGAKCTTATGLPVAGPSRSVVAFYAVETTGGGATAQCQESGA